MAYVDASAIVERYVSEVTLYCEWQNGMREHEADVNFIRWFEHVLGVPMSYVDTHRRQVVDKSKQSGVIIDFVLGRLYWAANLYGINESMRRWLRRT